MVSATALAERRRLLQALERAYSVRLTPFEEGVNPTALLAFGADPPPHRDVRTLCLAEPGHPDGMSSALEFLPDPLVPGSFPRSHGSPRAKAASLFRARHSQLSLRAHGNDHLRNELAELPTHVVNG